MLGVMNHLTVLREALILLDFYEGIFPECGMMLTGGTTSHPPPKYAFSLQRNCKHFMEM